MRGLIEEKVRRERKPIEQLSPLSKSWFSLNTHPPFLSTMLRFQLVIALVLLSLASAQISIEPFNEPPSLCAPVDISWTAGTPPFELKLFSDTRILSTLASLHVERSFSWTPLRVHPEESLYLTIYDGSRTTIGRSGRFGIRDDDEWEVVNETCRVVDQLERSVRFSEVSIFRFLYRSFKAEGLFLTTTHRSSLFRFSLLCFF